MTKQQLKIINLLSIVLLIALSVVSYFGVFDVTTYARETASLAAQGIGQDIANLFFTVPLLIVSLVLMNRKNKAATLIFGGTVFYIMYSFVFYGFSIHFNNLFLLYCIVLGSSLYLFIFFISYLNRLDIQSWFGNNTPVKIVGIYLITISVMFYLLWLKEIIPAILNNTVPKSISDANLLVNPIHVIDISFALPGLILTSVLLIKKHNLGFILAPVALVFAIILTVALAGMVIVLKTKGISEDLSIAGIFIVLASFSLILLVTFLKNIDTLTKT